MLRSVAKFFLGFTTVVAIATGIWLVAAFAGAGHDRLRSADAAQAKDELRRSENPSQKLDPANVWMSVRTPFGAFNFGFERDRM
jgi:hypothetical protein